VQFVEAAHDLFALGTHLAAIKGGDMPVLAVVNSLKGGPILH
jgi:hypothetical protein